MEGEKERRNSSIDETKAVKLQDISLTNSSKEIRRDNKAGGPLWYTVLLMYFFLLIITGSVTFLYNNGFASRDENLKKIESIKTSEQLVILSELLEKEINSMEAINSLASQSFNIVLGALLGFLSATVTTLNQKAEEKAESESNHQKNRAEMKTPQAKVQKRKSPHSDIG